MLCALYQKIELFKGETPSAGTKFRLMGLVADIAEVMEKLQREVLEVVRNEIVLDADTDIDYMKMSEQAMAMELVEQEWQADGLREQTQMVNDALVGLANTLADIAGQLERHHSEAEYTRLYEEEKKRYIGSGTYGRARKKFEEWKENECYGNPSMEDIADYLLEKLLHMFEKGVFDERVEHIQRAKKYPGEFDFEQLDSTDRLTKSVYHHYAAMRKLVDYKDGCLVVNPGRVGRHFYVSRKETNARSNRTNFLKYMHKISLAEDERARLLNAEQEGARDHVENGEEQNLFAPAFHLKRLLAEEWFAIHSTDKRYDEAWANTFVDKLMASEYGLGIATEWARKNRRDYLRGCVVGLLKEGGVLKGSMDSIARSTGVCDNFRTFSRYMGQGLQECYADWVLNYIREPISGG